MKVYSLQLVPDTSWCLLSTHNRRWFLTHSFPWTFSSIANITFLYIRQFYYNDMTLPFASATSFYAVISLYNGHYTFLFIVEIVAPFGYDCHSRHLLMNCWFLLILELLESKTFHCWMICRGQRQNRFEFRAVCNVNYAHQEWTNIFPCMSCYTVWFIGVLSLILMCDAIPHSLCRGMIESWIDWISPW